METSMPPSTVEKFGPEFMGHSYEIYARLRVQAPAREVVLPHRAEVWIVTRYDDIKTLLTNDPRVSKDGRRMNEMFAHHSGATAELAEETSEEADVGHGLRRRPVRATC